MTRTCTIPGCQSPHLARGWCNRHYRRWRHLGSPTATRQAPALVKDHHLAQMMALAKEGLSRREIAACTGWTYSTVRKHVGHIVCGVGAPTPDIARHRRMIKAAAAAEYGQRDAIARRFGLKNAMSLNVTLVTARRRVAEADQISEGR